MEQLDLYHHGIKGMKWGVRRYQNKNGSLTPAGKKRYKVDQSDVEAYGKRGAQRIADRRNKGDSRNKAVAKEVGRQIGTKLALSAATSIAVFGLYSGAASYGANKAGQAVGKAVGSARNAVDAGKSFVSSHPFYKSSILDSSGKVVSRYRNSLKVGETFVSEILRR